MSVDNIFFRLNMSLKFKTRCFTFNMNVDNIKHVHSIRV